MAERYAKLKDGRRYVVRYRLPKDKGYCNPIVIEAKGGKVFSVLVEERLVPGMAPRLDLGDRYRLVKRVRHNTANKR